jgi:hypothetical protein
MLSHVSHSLNGLFTQYIALRNCTCKHNVLVCFPNVLRVKQVSSSLSEPYKSSSSLMCEATVGKSATGEWSWGVEWLFVIPVHLCYPKPHVTQRIQRSVFFITLSIKAHAKNGTYTHIASKQSHSLAKSLLLISGFRRDVHENCTLLGYYAASCVYRRFRRTYRSHLQGSSREDGTDTLSRNVGKHLPHDAA